MNILLVDDHALFRAGLRMLIAAVGVDVNVIEASTADEALARIGEDDIRLCLLDLQLKSSSGVSLLEAIKQSMPQIVVVVVSGADDAATIRACIEAGAMSFISKSAAPDVLTAALRHVLRGDVYLPEQITFDAKPATRPSLTPRQRDVLKCLSQGLPTKLIARELALSEYTIKEHIASIFQVLHVRNRTEAVICASRMFLLSTP